MAAENKKHPFSPRQFIRGGVHAAHRKNTVDCATVQLPVPARVAVVMQQHIGAPCLPVVKKGDQALVGTLIGNSDKYVSAPIYSSVSGTVAEIGELMLPSGAMTQAVIIDTDGEQTLQPGITPPVVETREQLLDAVRGCGLVGLGGAGFPAHVKLNPATPVDTLVVNGAECEPYITADYREMIESTADIISGIQLITRLLSMTRAVIVVENNKPVAIKRLREQIKQCGAQESISVMSTVALYPRGAEKVTVYAATGRKIPAGKLPADVGCVVMNVSSVATVARYVATGMPLVSKRITVDGSAVARPVNVSAPVGTYIKDIIEFAGGYSCEPKKIIMGGPMMGVAMPSDDMPIMKQTNAILALSEREAYPKPQSACIKCGRCVRHCPMSLMPTKIEDHFKAKDAAALQRDGVMNCIECGCCAYVCPAARPMVQVMRQSKSIVRREGK